MDIRAMLGGAGHVIAAGAKGAAKGAGALARDLTGTGGPSEGDQSEMLKQFAEQSASELPQEPERPPFALPELDDSMSNEGLKRKEAFEAANPGTPYQPTAEDFTDAGEYGYLHKKKTHDLLMELEQEMEANKPHVDYEGILKQRMADLDTMPKEHRNNPLLMFAMALGGGEKAQELVKAYTAGNAKSNTESMANWEKLLQTKQDVIKGAMQQAMQQGDMRTIVSKKWADQLMEIEAAKAELAGKKALEAEKGLNSATTAKVRGEWALRAAKARTEAMLTSAGMRVDGAQARALLDSATRRINTRINKGQDPESAYEDVMSEMDDEIDAMHVTPKTAATATPGSSATPSAAPPASENPLERAARLRRESAAKKP